MTPRSTFYSASSLFLHAKTACKRSCESTGSADAVTYDSLTAIVFSAAALEGFMNELPIMAGELTIRQPESTLAALHSLLEELEESRASVASKLCFARWVLSGSTFSKGEQPFQDFKLLIDVRNALLHLREESYEQDIE